MKLPEDLLRQPVELATRRLALHLLTHATKACDRLADPQASEALHDFRVSVRRLRTCLKTYRPHLSRKIRRTAKPLRGVMSATNTGRDDEVHALWLRDQLAQRRLPAAERTGIRVMLDELEARRARETASTHEVAIRFTQTAASLKQELEHGSRAIRLDDAGNPVLFTREVGHRLAARSDELDQQLRRIGSIDDQTACHDSRLAAKRLRYTLEPIATDVRGGRRAVRTLKQLQDLLGVMHDLHTLQSAVESTMERTACDWAHHLHRIAVDAPRLADLKRRAQRLDGCHALAAVSRRVARRQRVLYRSLVNRWLDGRAARFRDGVDEIVRQLLPAVDTVEPVEEAVTQDVQGAVESSAESP